MAGDLPRDGDRDCHSVPLLQVRLLICLAVRKGKEAVRNVALLTPYEGRSGSASVSAVRLAAFAGPVAAESDDCLGSTRHLRETRSGRCDCDHMPTFRYKFGIDERFVDLALTQTG
jgi:hypothetical protein